MRDDELPLEERLGLGEEDDFQNIYVGPVTPSYNFNRVIFYGYNNSEKQGVVFKVRMVKYLSKI